MNNRWGIISVHCIGSVGRVFRTGVSGSVTMIVTSLAIVVTTFFIPCLSV
jgi:hypothetical protein